MVSRKHFMISDLKARVSKVGQAPGTLSYTGYKTDVVPVIKAVSYSLDKFNEFSGTTLDADFIQTADNAITWVHTEGLSDIGLVERVATNFELHLLTVEDILNVSQRSKIEDFDGYIFITLKVLFWDDSRNITEVEQLSLVIGKNFVLSFSESPLLDFEVIRNRIRTGGSKNLLGNGSDYLAYRLMDSTIDQYFLVIDKLNDQIEEIEKAVITNPSPKNANKIYALKHEILLLRKAVWPIREEISHLLASDRTYIKSFTRVYFRDVYDHAIQAIDNIEILRDMLSSILDIYLSSVTNKLNEIMKLLTIISTFFIPMSFIASFYGMNFKYMPELQWRYSYPIVVGIMVLIACGMLKYFRKKKWI